MSKYKWFLNKDQCVVDQEGIKNLNQVRHKAMRIMLLLLTLPIITTTGCATFHMECKDVSVELTPGNCMEVLPVWDFDGNAFLNNTFENWPEDAPDNVMCDGRFANDSEASLVGSRRGWDISRSFPGIYQEIDNQGHSSVCVTNDAPAYTSQPVGYTAYGQHVQNDSFIPIGWLTGGGKFIITSESSGPLNVTASAGRDNIPFGSSTGLFADIGGGTGPDFYFLWDPADSLGDPNAQNAVATPTLTTDYTVTVTDSAGDSTSGEVTVTVNLGFTVSASPSTINFGETSRLNVTAGGGTRPYKYTFETEDGTALETLIDDPFLVVSPSETTNYIVTVTDNIGDTVTGSVAVIVGPPPVLRIIKFSDPDTVRAGDVFNYQIVVDNIGQGTATNVVLRDPLPPEVTLNAPLPFGCIDVDSDVTCGLGDLAPGESETVTINATVGPGVTGTIVNTAYVRSNETAEISDTWTINVCSATAANCFDLSIDKTATTLATIGSNVSYGLSVANIGPDEATDVIVIDHLPNGFEFDPVNSSSACSSVCSTVTCSLGNYAPGFSELITFEATVTPQASPGTNVNTATVFSSVAQDPVSGNNSASANTSVIINPSGLEITGIVATPFAIDPGDLSQLGVVVQGGSEPYSFLWTADPRSGNPPDGGIASGDETLQFPWVTPLSPTEYTVVVTDASGYTASASVRVSVGFTVWADADPTDIIFGDSSQLFATVVGGVEPYTYAWGGPGLNFYDIVNPIAIPNDDTEYQVFVFDNIGNFTSHSVNVNVAMTVTVMAFPEVINSGDQVELIAQVQGGAFPYTFEWTPANGLDPVDLNNWNPIVTPSVSTTYEMTVIDANGKVGIECVHVQVIPP